MYKLIKDPSSGCFYFQTENGLTYICQLQNCTRYLSPVLGIYDIEICTFDFFCHAPDSPSHTLKKFDSNVSATISHLLLKSFENKLRVVIYLCDTSDGRHKERHRLFRNWFNGLNKPRCFNRIPIEIDTENAEITFQVHGSVLTRQDFPYMDVLKREFIDEIPNLIGQKIGLQQPN